MRPVILSTAYWAPISYYAKLYSCEIIYKERNEHYVKQSYRNRCVIATAGGVQTLTVPVERDGEAKTFVRDVRISDHGNWRHLHWNALVSAYKNSPFFEYYADDFRHFYEQKYRFLFDFNEEIERCVCELLGLGINSVLSETYFDAAQLNADDFRNLISPKHACSADPTFSPKPYCQVFREKYGFLPDLSIADLLFNMGPEARLEFRDSVVE